MSETTNTEVPETESQTGPADSVPTVTAKVARKPKSCALCGAVGKNTRTHGKTDTHPATAGEAADVEG